MYDLIPRLLCILILLNAINLSNSQDAQFETKSRVDISDRGYKDLVVAIGAGVEEDGNLIEELKSVLTDFSRYLHTLTGFYLRNVRILIPESWSSNPSLYSPVTWETFENSDIRIDHIEDGEASVHAPYTNKPSQCGSPGRYIHLTPTFIEDRNIAMAFGGHGKVLVREWAKYRWGVFEESPDGNDPTFYASSSGDIEGTKCSKERKGTWQTSTGRRCYPFLQSTEDCLYMDLNRGGSGQASIMYRQYLSGIDQFCEDEGMTTVSEVLHNVEAPNQQNRHCDRRSIMQVLREHPDFRTVGARVSWTEPTFDIVRRSVGKVVLVLDRSSSMKDFNRIHILRQAAYNFITRVIPDGQRLGIVQFNGNSGDTDIKSPLREIDDTSRQELLITVPENVNGMTSIGAGVRNGLKVLADGRNGNPAGGIMILITDGEETETPLISRLLIEDKQELSTITIHTIAVGPEADNDLETLANFTQGRHFHHTDSSTTLFDVFSQFGFEDTVRTTSEIFSSSFRLASMASMVEGVNVDSSIEGDVLFLIGADSIESLVVVIERPDRSEITLADSELYTRIPKFRLIKVKTSDVMYGQWTITIQNHDTQSKNVSVVVEGGVSRTTPIISVDARWAVGTLMPPDAQTLFVTVSKGYVPVGGAFVTATVSHDDGQVKTRLYDDGVGADVRANDGIYSRYITKFDGVGRYGAKVSVSGIAGVTKILRGRRLGSAAPSNSVSQNKGSTTDIETGAFQRVIDGGSFKCSDNSTCEEQTAPRLYGPAKVTDLRVENIDLTKMEVDLVFTAPGGDLMDGRAESYTIRWATSFDTLHENFNANPTVQSSVDPNSVYYTSARKNLFPKMAREREVFPLRLPALGNFSYVFALTATDVYGVVSPISNFASVSAKNFPVLQTTIMTHPPKTTTTTTVSDSAGNALESTGNDASFPWYIILVALLALILFLLFLLIFVLRRKSKETDEATNLPRLEDSYDGIHPTVSSNVRYSSNIEDGHEYSSVGVLPVNEYAALSSAGRKVQQSVKKSDSPGYDYASGIPSQDDNVTSSAIAHPPPSYAFATGIVSPSYGVSSSKLKRNPSLDKFDKSKVAFGSSANGDDVNSAYDFVQADPHDGGVNQQLRHSGVVNKPYKPQDETGVKRASVAENNKVAAEGRDYGFVGVPAKKDDTKEASIKSRGEKASKGKLPPR